MSEIMKDNLAQWTDLENRIEKINEDAKHFGKSTPKF